ncbi:MAG: EAL domain-containing protein [Hyphomicrobiaceae bacterium]
MTAARLVLVLVALAMATIVGAGRADALEAIDIDRSTVRIDLTDISDQYAGRGDRLQIETAAGQFGIASRVEVPAQTPGTNPNWMVFALHNATDRRIERWLVSERYSIIGSGLLWPDLDQPRLLAVTPSLGLVPDLIPNDRADVFRLTLEPGETITFAVELASDRFPKTLLWDPLVYEKKLRDRSLFNGIMLGISGLIAIFLIAIFAANHRSIFPASAMVAASVLAYLCVDFGFWNKIFQLSASENATYRAATESAFVASLVVFFYVFLRLGLWHGWIRLLFAVWILGQIGLVAGAIVDPLLASTLARSSLLFFSGIGSLVIGYLAVRGQDRALALLPAWLLLMVWVFAAALAAEGRLNGDVVISGLVSGIVLITLLKSFIVTQFAFRAFEPLYGAPQNELQTRAVAIEAGGAAVWEWNSRRNEIQTSGNLEALLGLTPGELSCRVDDWTKHMHSSDRERFRLMLLSLQEKNGGSLNAEFRMRRSDGSYRWFELTAETLPASDQRTLKCVGLLRDVTAAKRAHERLVHDAVHDNLTGLPNRELFLDRLAVAIDRARQAGAARPTVLFIDIDRFKNVNNAFGLIVGDSMLLTTARRLSRHLAPGDTLARITGDRFAILLTSEFEPREVAMLAERVRRSLRTPLKINGKEVVLTGSIGIAVYDGEQASHQDLLKEAETAMYRAKRAGSDRIEIFKPSMRGETDERVAIESELRRAVERKQIHIHYQPILRFSNEELAGFEALVRWEHPRLGTLNPSEFIPIAEEADLITQIGSHVLERAAEEAARWQKTLGRSEDPLFVSVNISSRQLFRQDLVQEIRVILGRETVPKGCLKLEVTESLVMENPERAAEILDWLKQAGAGLSIDDFGTGYSSLAYLTRFAFDTIKLDRTLVGEVSRDAQAGAVVRSVVALAHELGRVVVAEGVEEPEDAQFLRAIGCELAQGFLYGEPMTEREVIELLKVMRKTDRKVERRGLLSGLTRRAGKSKDDAGATGDQGPGAFDEGAPEPGGESGAGSSAAPSRGPATGAGPTGDEPGRGAGGAHPGAATTGPGSGHGMDPTAWNGRHPAAGPSGRPGAQVPGEGAAREPFGRDAHPGRDPHQGRDAHQGREAGHRDGVPGGGGTHGSGHREPMHRDRSEAARRDGGSRDGISRDGGHPPGSAAAGGATARPVPPHRDGSHPVGHGAGAGGATAGMAGGSRPHDGGGSALGPGGAAGTPAASFVPSDPRGGAAASPRGASSLPEGAHMRDQASERGAADAKGRQFRPPQFDPRAALSGEGEPVAHAGGDRGLPAHGAGGMVPNGPVPVSPLPGMDGTVGPGTAAAAADGEPGEPSQGIGARVEAMRGGLAKLSRRMARAVTDVAGASAAGKGAGPEAGADGRGTDGSTGDVRGRDGYGADGRETEERSASGGMAGNRDGGAAAGAPARGTTGAARPIREASAPRRRPVEGASGRGEPGEPAAPRGSLAELRRGLRSGPGTRGGGDG